MPTLKAKIGGAWVPIAGPGSGADEVFVGASDPGAAYELWYDTDEPSVPPMVSPPTTFATSGGVWGVGTNSIDVLDVLLGLAAYPCVMEVSVAFVFGFGGAVEVNPRLYMYQGNTYRALGQNIPVAASKWASAAFTWAWAVPNGGQLSFRLQSVIATSGQGCYTECFGTWRRYPT